MKTRDASAVRRLVECSREENGNNEQRERVKLVRYGGMSAVLRHVVLLEDLTGSITDRVVWR